MSIWLGYSEFELAVGNSATSPIHYIPFLTVKKKLSEFYVCKMNLWKRKNPWNPEHDSVCRLNQITNKDIIKLKGNKYLISSDPPCKNGNARFTIVPLKPLSDQKCGRYCRFWLEKCIILRVSPMLFIRKTAQVTFAKNPQMKINSLKKQKLGYLINT